MTLLSLLSLSFFPLSLSLLRSFLLQSKYCHVYMCVYTYVPVRCFVTYLIANNLYLVLFFLLAVLSPVQKAYVNNKMAKKHKSRSQRVAEHD